MVFTLLDLPPPMCSSLPALPQELGTEPPHVGAVGVTGIGGLGNMQPDVLQLAWAAHQMLLFLSDPDKQPFTAQFLQVSAPLMTLVAAAVDAVPSLTIEALQALVGFVVPIATAAECEDMVLKIMCELRNSIKQEVGVNVIKRVHVAA